MESEEKVAADAKPDCRVCDGRGWHWGWDNAKCPVRLRCPCVDEVRARPKMSDDLLTKEFVPCVVVMDDPKRTEMVLRDCPTFWVQDHRGSHLQDIDLGYDLETRELVAIRVYGDVSERK